MSKKRILVVEDNPDNMTLIVDILTSLDYDVLKAKDGLLGVEMAEENPDLILMDLSLPKLDGWAATQRIKAKDHLQSIPIVALTAHAMLGDRERAIAAGCDDYLSKPINVQELANKLAQYIG